MALKKTASTTSSRKRASITTQQIEQTPMESPVERVRKPRNYIPLLIVALLMVSFMLGMAFMKIQYLENQAKQTAQVAANTQGANAQPTTPSGPAAKVDVANGHFPLQGDANAKVTIVEFADFRCPFCEKLYQDTVKQIRKDYIDPGKIKLAFRHYAFLGPASVIAANAAECANDQGKFWDMHDYFYEHQPDESDISMYTTDNLTPIAGTLGMNTDQFKACLDGKKFDKNVSDDLAAGQKAGVSGTPTLFINGITVVGAQPYSAIKAIIDQEIAKAK